MKQYTLIATLLLVLVPGSFGTMSASAVELVHVLPSLFYPRQRVELPRQRVESRQRPSPWSLIVGPQAPQPYSQFLSTSPVHPGRGVVPAYRWGYFGAKSRPTCSSHYGYYGDLTQWRTGW